MNLDMWKAQIETGSVEEKREAIRLAKNFSPSEVIDVLIECLYDPNKAVQEAVIETLIEMPDPVVVEKLLPLLREENPEVRNASIEILENIGKDFVDLIGKYLDDEDKDVRLFVCDIIGKFGTEKALEYLSKALSDPEVNVRNSAVMGIGRIPHQKSVEVLRDLLEKEQDSWVRFSIIDALTQIGGALAKKVLKEALHKEKNEVVLKALLDAIAKFGESDFILDALYVFDFLMTKKLSDVYTDLVDLGIKAESFDDKKVLYKMAVYLCAYIKYSDDRWTAYRAVSIIPKLGDCAEELALDVLATVSEPMIIAGCIEALGEVGTERSIPVLEGFLNSDDERQRELAQDSIAKIRERINA